MVVFDPPTHPVTLGHVSLDPPTPQHDVIIVHEKWMGVSIYSIFCWEVAIHTLDLSWKKMDVKLKMMMMMMMIIWKELL